MHSWSSRDTDFRFCVVNCLLQFDTARKTDLISLSIIFYYDFSVNNQWILSMLSISIKPESVENHAQYLSMKFHSFHCL